MDRLIDQILQLLVVLSTFSLTANLWYRVPRPWIRRCQGESPWGPRGDEPNGKLWSSPAPVGREGSSPTTFL